MAGRWSDDRERDFRDRDRERYDDRYDVYGRNEAQDRWSGSETRSFNRGSERVFGERESGAGYNLPRGEGPERESRPGAGDRDWQDRDYEGVSPAMRRSDYDSGYRGSDRDQDRRGGRFYGDDGRGRVYRAEYDYGAGTGGHEPEGRRFGAREADQRWAREMRPPVSGGTGGYDYERGYGDAGRSEGRGHEPVEDRARDAGDFLRRTGQRISSWFSDVAGEGAHDRSDTDDRRREDHYRGARGLGPKGYKRSDERVNDDVHQRLSDDPWLDASNIDVSVSGGEVTLSGTVDSRESKHRAERIVEDLSGVNHVQNNLRVQSGNYFTSAGKGYGDSVQEARMASSEPKDTSASGASAPKRS